jgi:hypothetical protein
MRHVLQLFCMHALGLCKNPTQTAPRRSLLCDCGVRLDRTSSGDQGFYCICIYRQEQVFSAAV